MNELFVTLSPSIQRLDSSVLERDLPPIQQAVIHVKQTKAQMKLYRAFKKYQIQSENNNFLEQYSKLFSVNNHPGSLLFRRSSAAKSKKRRQSKESVELPDISKTTFPHLKRESTPVVAAAPIAAEEPVFEKSQGSVEVIVIDDSDEKDDDVAGSAGLTTEASNETDEVNMELYQNEYSNDASDKNKEEWWEKVYIKNPNMGAIQNGGKVMLLLQVLAHSESIGKLVPLLDILS